MLSNVNIGKWQLALILGTSIGIGITYLYWRRTTIPELPDDDDNKKKKKGAFGSISIDKDEGTVIAGQKEDQKHVELTPLEKSLKFKVDGKISSKISFFFPYHIISFF
jgi:hypothetical protein